jgi:hypothetical protein
MQRRAGKGRGEQERYADAKVHPSHITLEIPHPATHRAKP